MNKKIGLIILDGVGINKNKAGNAVFLAKTPVLDKLMTEFPNSLLEASGKQVGLPEGQMGNSEVGHLNIGAGRVVFTGLSLINKEIEDNKFQLNTAFINAANHCVNNKSKMHLIGLFSDGGVHSCFNHIKSLITFCASKKIETVLHCICDGRDVDQKSFINDIDLIEEWISEFENIKIGTISGRYYTMDRDQRWERTETSFDALTGHAGNLFTNASEYIAQQYKEGNTDEFVMPAMNANFSIDKISMANNDSVIMMNFRPDRARQICHCIFNSKLYSYQPSIKLENIFLVTMTNYEGIIPSEIAYPPIELLNVLGKVLEDNNKSQLRVAETEKYAHVTFFFDGGKDLLYKNEEKKLIPSPKVATYDLCPQMSANGIKDYIIKNMNKFDVTISNFANPDMVGHTGMLDKTIEAVEFVDKCLGEIVEKAKKDNITLFITGDHGNADVMLDENNNVVTKHSISPVMFISTDKSIQLEDGNLSNISPTILEYMGIKKPIEMTSKSLLLKK